MSVRRAFLDRGVGETRGVITLDERPERLIVWRDGDEPRLALGARLIARVEGLEPALGAAFLDLGDGAQAILPFKPEARPVRGAAVEVEIRSEPRDGKLATARLIGDGQGVPRIIAPAPDVAEVLASLVRDSTPAQGREARIVADEAEAEVLQTIHALPGGGSLAIEPTRALTAVDVDVGERKGADAKRVMRQTNLMAIAEGARLLRLKGIGGLIVLDLAGRGHDGNALLAAARLAFAPDNPGVAIGPVGRFGTMELLAPRRTRPLAERLLEPGGGLSARTLGQRLIRQIETEAGARPGSRLLAVASPAAAAAAEFLAPKLAERIGARFTIRADISYPRERLEVGVA
jgi:hypothetical protein